MRWRQGEAVLVTWPEFCRKGPRRPAQQTTCHVTVPELSGCVSRPLVVTEVVAEGVQGSQQLLAQKAVTHSWIEATSGRC